jgi:hypothetical protein
MKKFLPVLIFFVSAFTAKAQTRYLDEVFSSVQVDTSIVYAQNYEFFTGFGSLQPLIMDVYRPAGDTATHRPLILLSHNGSFLPEVFTHGLAGLCFNGIKDSSTVELCKRFARRGYVAVSFNYRLGWAATASDQETRTKTIIQAVYRAMQDAKACVRYFKNDYAANSNSYGIDTGKIVIGGTNSGAYVALAAGSLNDSTELSNLKFVGSQGPFIKQDTLGDFDGFGGVQNYSGNYPGISSRFECVLSLGGAVGDTSWIQTGEPPVIAFQGVNESGTPYNTAIVTTTTGQPVIEVSGSGDFMPYIDTKGNNNVFKPNSFLQGPPNRNGLGQQTISIEGLYPFYGQYFEPWNWYDPNCYNNSQQMQQLTDPINSANWATPAKGNRYIDTIMGYTLPRLYKLFINNSFSSWTWNGISETAPLTHVSLFPNPAANEVTFTADDKPVTAVLLFDIAGRLVKESNGINAFTKTISLTGLNSGVYLVSVKLAGGEVVNQKLMVEK